MKNTHYLTTDDVCRSLGICRRALFYRIEKRGLHAAQKIGRRWRFSPDVFESPLALPG